MARIPEELKRRIKGALGVDPPDELEGEALLSYIEEVRKTSPGLYRELVDALQEQAVLEVGRTPSVKTPRPLSLARFLYKQDEEGNWVFDRRRGIALTLVLVLGVIFLIQFLMAPRGRKTAGSPPPRAVQETTLQETQKEEPPKEAPSQEVPLPPQTSSRKETEPPPPPSNPTPDLPPPPDYEGEAPAERGIAVLYRRERAEKPSGWAPVRPPSQGEKSAEGPLVIVLRKAPPSQGEEGNSWITLPKREEDRTAPTWQKVERKAQGGEAPTWIRREAPKEAEAPFLITPKKTPSAQEGEMVTVYRRGERKGESWIALDGTPSVLTGQPSPPAEGQGETGPPASEGAETPKGEGNPTPLPKEEGEEKTP